MRGPSLRMYAFQLLPCAAVIAGLWLLRSAWAAILLYHSLIVVYLLVTRREGVRGRMLSGWSAPAGLGLAAVCACSLPMLVFLWPCAGTAGEGLSDILGSFGLRGTGLIVFAAYFIFVHPALEEAFWRGAVPADRRGLDFPDFAFSAYHVLVLVHFIRIPWVIASFVILVSMSWLWRLAARRQGGLAVPLFSHMIAGAGIMTAVFLITGR